MDGVIDWQALPAIVELYAIEDVELFIYRLRAIRDHIRLLKSVS